MARIRAVPNPVVLMPGEPGRPTEIRWNTQDDTVKGEVWYSIKGMAGEERLDPPVEPQGQPPAPRATQGRFQTPFPIKPQKTYIFTLYSFRGHTELASVEVTAQSMKEASSGRASDAVLELGLVQAIRYLKIQPGPDYAQFTFSTTQPTVPILVVTSVSKDPNKAPRTDVAWSLGTGNRTEHYLRARGLYQDADCTFELTAASNGEPAVVTGKFTTGWRDVDVVFEKIIMDRLELAGGGISGVPPRKLTSHFGIYRGPTADGQWAEEDGSFLGPDPSLISTPVYSTFAGLDVDVTRTTYLPNCPRLLSLWVRTFVDVSDDSDTVLDDVWEAISGEPFTDGTRFYPPASLPDARPRASYGRDDLDEWATAEHEFSLPDVRNDPVTKVGFGKVGFGISSGNDPLKFGVTGRFEITSFSPPLRWVWSTFPKKNDASKGLLPGGKMPVPWTGRKMFLSLAPDGTLFQQPVGGTGQISPPSAIGGGLAGPLTLVPGNDQQLHLVGRSPRGSVLTKRWVSDNWQPAGQEWVNLGGTVRGRITAVNAPQGGLHLFAVTPEHTVCYKHYDGRGGRSSTRGWVNLGAQVREPIAAASSPDGSVDVFALSRTGSVLHKSLRGPRWTPAGARWEDLGGQFEGCGTVLGAARADEGQLAVLVFDSEGRTYRKFWDGHVWSPSGRKWETLERHPIVVTPPPEGQTCERPRRDHCGADPSQGAPGPGVSDSRAPATDSNGQGDVTMEHQNGEAAGDGIPLRPRGQRTAPIAANTARGPRSSRART